MRTATLLVLLILTGGCSASATSEDASPSVDAPDAAPGTPDARPGTPDAQPDAATPRPDAAPTPPDAAPPPPDAHVATADAEILALGLPPPRQCDNQFFVPGCIWGDRNSACGGVCSGGNACEDIRNKPGTEVGFLCPRFALGAAEMEQAARDDFGAGTVFDYGIVGHDTDTGGVDVAGSACCQCYQLVFDLPEGAARIGGNGPSAIPIPRPLIVQAFNTAAGGGHNFDLFMGAGGFGAFNACDPLWTQMPSASGHYMYSRFPQLGEPGGGGVNGALRLDACHRPDNAVTPETLSSPACRAGVMEACTQFESATLDERALANTVNSCLKSNSPTNYTHLNWEVYIKRIECPETLTDVTGCKLAPQGLPAADVRVRTPEQAKADPTFRSHTAGGVRYTTTTMQDCCKPSCAWQDWVSGSIGGRSVVGQYNSFYTCDVTGAPLTE